MRLPLFVLLCLAFPTQALGQSVSVKWSALNKPVYLHTAMPSGCDVDLERAVAAWNNTGSKFTYSFNRSTNLTSTRGTATTNAYPIIEDGVTSSSTALATTNRYTSGSTITQTDIIVKGEYLWYYSDESGGKFHCSSTGTSTPSTKYDYQTAITHELGHAFGMDHGGSTSCIMYASLGAGTMRRTACSTESSAMRTAYGVR